MVVDATGNGAFTGALSVVAQDSGIPLVSGALYRGGSIARVQRQALPDDVPLHRREDTPQFPAIPAGDGRYDFASPALACSAPVNNAPPASVTACAALIVQMALDALTGRFEFNDEVMTFIGVLQSRRLIGSGEWDRLRARKHITSSGTDVRPSLMIGACGGSG